MKRFSYLVLALLLSILFACSPNFNLGVSTSMLSEKLTYIAGDWGRLNADPSISQEVTYIPEVGVRGRYIAVEKVLGKKVVEGIVGEKAFVKGPHQGQLDFKSRGSFGYYSPTFLTRLQSLLVQAYQNSVFVKTFQSFYNQELRQYLRTYYLTYQAGISNDNLRKKYLSLMAIAAKTPGATYESPSYFLQESFRSLGDDLSLQGYDWYEATTCPAFWLRRSVDGTADEFYQLLTLTLKTFDPEFLDN
ncbi:MAG: hypothetical protein H6555_10490 [Lewinellaceae bacterium]|nr:hypothetical protein [Lewinellaceae bacterium]